MDSFLPQIYVLNFPIDALVFGREDRVVAMKPFLEPNQLEVNILA